MAEEITGMRLDVQGKRRRRPRPTRPSLPWSGSWSRQPGACGEDLTGPQGLEPITATALGGGGGDRVPRPREKYQAPTAENGTIRNGTRPMMVLTGAAGEVMIAVPGRHVRTGDRPRSDNDRLVDMGCRRDQPSRHGPDHR